MPRRGYGHHYERLRREEERLRREVKSAPTVQERTAKYVAWLEVRQARRAAAKGNWVPCPCLGEFEEVSCFSDGQS